MVFRLLFPNYWVMFLYLGHTVCSSCMRGMIAQISAKLRGVPGGVDPARLL
jgi:hypothetical protein